MMDKADDLVKEKQNKLNEEILNDLNDEKKAPKIYSRSRKSAHS